MSAIRETIEKMIAEKLVVTVQYGTVAAIDEETATVVSDHDETEFFKVSFNALAINGANRFQLTPRLGSKVVLGVLPNGTDAVILAFSAVDRLHYTTDTTVFEVDSEGHRIEKSGEDLKTVINDMIDELNKIVVIQGTSINVVAMEAIKTRFNQILK